MTSTLRVQVEQPTKGKKWVGIAIDWPGLEQIALAGEQQLEGRRHADP